MRFPTFSRALPTLLLCGAILGVVTACGSSESDVQAPPVTPTVIDTTSITPATKPHSSRGAGSNAGNNQRLPGSSGGERLTQIPDPVQISQGQVDNTAKTTLCGLAPAATGTSLNVLSVNGAPCSSAMPVAQQYAPHVGDGQVYTYSDWSCGPATLRGYLGQCSAGTQSFVLEQK